MANTAGDSLLAFPEHLDPKRVLLTQVASMNLTNAKLESVLLDDLPGKRFAPRKADQR